MLYNVSCTVTKFFSFLFSYISLLRLPCLSNDKQNVFYSACIVSEELTQKFNFSCHTSHSKSSVDPFLRRPGKFSGPKSHFKNHEAFDVQSVICQQVLHLSKAYTYVTFPANPRICLVFQLRTFKVGFLALSRNGPLGLDISINPATSSGTFSN